VTRAPGGLLDQSRISRHRQDVDAVRGSQRPRRLQRRFRAEEHDGDAAHPRPTEKLRRTGVRLRAVDEAHFRSHATQRLVR